MENFAPDGVALVASTAMVDGMRTDTASNSPTSSSGAPSRQRPRQVPIARNAGSGYERPERARTSHACEPCRERKTKCDGERPSCRRCLHTGTSCHYGYGKGWKKRKTAEDLTVTSRKLARYETLLTDIFPLVSQEVRLMIDDARQQEFMSGGLTDGVDAILHGSANAFETDYKSTSPSAPRMPLPVPASASASLPGFLSTPRSLPPPLQFDSSNSPIRPTPSSESTSRSPPDDLSGVSAVRLPSITRHGYLVDQGVRSPVIPGLSPRLGIAQMQEDRSSTMADGETSQRRVCNVPPPD